MTFFRLGILAAVTSLSSCTLSTAPEPPEFKLSAEALSKQYRATRKTGAVSLYAQEIQTTRDEWGRETHVASGGALLVKDAMTPIQALAPSISITPEFSEVRGKSTVKKDDRLYLGQDESTIIRIDGMAIKPEGPHVIRGIASETAAAEAKARAEAKAEAKAESKAKAEEEAKLKAEAKAQAKVEKANAEAEVKAQKVAEDRAKSEATAMAKTDAEATAQAEKAEAKVKVADEVRVTPKKIPASSASAPAKKKKVAANSKPKAKSTAPAKPSTPADKPKVVPAVDRARLLNLMREPTDR